MAWHWFRPAAAVAALIAACAIASGCAQQSAAPSSAQTATAEASETATAGPAASASSTPTPSASSSPSSSDVAQSASPEAGQSPASSRPEAPAQSPSASSTPTPFPKASQPATSASPSPSAPPANEAARSVTFSIAGNAEWGDILPASKVELRKNETMAELLIRTLKARKLAYETRGRGALFYVAGIDGLFEFDDGPTSGWKYRVNGKVESVGAGVYEPKPGDAIEWFYVSEDEEAEQAGEEQAP